MRTRTLLAAAAALLAATGCSSTDAPDPAPTIPLRTAPVTPAKSGPHAAGQVTAAGLGDGWEATSTKTPPQVRVCDKPVLPAATNVRTTSVLSPDGHHATVGFLDVTDAPDAAEQVSDAFGACALATDGDTEILSWSDQSSVLSGGYTGQTVQVAPDGTVLTATSVAIAPVDGDTVAVVTVTADDKGGAGTDRLSLYTDKLLQSVLPVGAGEPPAPAPDWRDVDVPTYDDGNEDLPDPEFEIGPKDENW